MALLTVLSLKRTDGSSPPDPPNPTKKAINISGFGLTRQHFIVGSLIYSVSVSPVSPTPHSEETETRQNRLPLLNAMQL